MVFTNNFVLIGGDLGNLMYDPIIDNYASLVDIAGSPDELQTVWRDARDFCASQLSKFPDPPGKLKRFHGKACACLKVLEG